MPDLYEPFEEDEAAIRAALLAGTIGGVLGLLRRPTLAPRDLGRLVRRRQTARIFRKTWWRGSWNRFEDVMARRLVALSQKARARVLRELSADLARPISNRVAERIVREFTADLAREVREATESGVLSIADELRLRDASTRELREMLLDRLGPTEKQMRAIRRAERRWRAEGVSEAEISRRSRARALRASGLRADVMASDSVVERVSAERMEVFTEAGVLVYSWNPLDGREDPKDRQQALWTRADPRPAGQGWTPRAPYRGMMPYHRRCRCGVRRVPA